MNLATPDLLHIGTCLSYILILLLREHAEELHSC